MKRETVKKILSQVAAIVLSACALVVFFIGGYNLGKKSAKGSVDDSSVSWLKSVIETYYYEDVDTDSFYEYALDAFVDKYLDQYSEYYTAEEYAAEQESNAGSKSGLGIQNYTYLSGYGILIGTVIYNSPAYISGLRGGEFIVSAYAEGEAEVKFSSLSEFLSYTNGFESGEDITFCTLDGEEYTMAKAEYTASYVMCATNSSSWEFTGSGTPVLTQTDKDAIEELPDGAGYIGLYQFYGDCSSEFAQAVEVLNGQGCTSIILDLRNNGGGYVDDMKRISACFVGGGEVAMTAQYKSGSVDTMYTDATYVTSKSRMVDSEKTQVYVLANSNTASAAEALIGVLISYGVIDYSDIYISEYTDEYISLVGGTAQSLKSGKTYGKGIMQSSVTNSSTGEVLKLTTAKTYWPNGKTIHGVGVTTDDDGATAVTAPYPSSGAGDELSAAIKMIYGL